MGEIRLVLTRYRLDARCGDQMCLEGLQKEA